MTGPTCIHCPARFDYERQVFLDPHSKSCPLYRAELANVRREEKVPNEDKKHYFSDCWPGRWPGYVSEYRFAAELVGMGSGIRSRLVAAGLQDWRFDFAWPGYMVAVEVDGNAHHVMGGGRHMQDGDLTKLNNAAVLGWTVFRFSPGMLKEDPNLVTMVHDHLMSLGLQYGGIE